MENKTIGLRESWRDWTGKREQGMEKINEIRVETICLKDKIKYQSR